MFLGICNLEIGLYNFTLILQTLHLHSMSYFLVGIFLTAPLLEFSLAPSLGGAAFQTRALIRGIAVLHFTQSRITFKIIKRNQNIFFLTANNQTLCFPLISSCRKNGKTPFTGILQSMTKASPSILICLSSIYL